MIRKLPRLLSIKEQSSTHVTLGWKNQMTGHIALRHELGLSEEMTASQVKRIRGTPDYSAPATAKQAKALVDIGFQRRGKKKKWIKASRRWIQENLTLGQAGIILKTMGYISTGGKKKWDIPTPQRRFLGEPQEYMQYELDSIIRFIEQEQRKRG
ncbi:hypothetical protein CGX12_16640 [Zobellella denitrificans]|nr:hypothetical protein CGX12_16640 [Zobellella denitrificans]